MTRTYLILKTTDKISRAVDHRSISDAHQSLIELRDDMQEYTVADDAYRAILDDVEELIEASNVEKDVIEDLSEELASSIIDTIHRVQSLYLRATDTETNNQESIKQLREERNFYRSKLWEYNRALRKALTELQANQIETKIRLAEASEKIESLTEKETPDFEPDPAVRDVVKKLDGVDPDKFDDFADKFD
jgi:hypothetical protein